jgi:hypothetical protein
MAEPKRAYKDILRDPPSWAMPDTEIGTELGFTCD